jgi:phenylacetate-CoA ligase
MSQGAQFYDEQETRDPQARADALCQALTRQIARAKAGSETYGRLLADIDPTRINNPDALASLPLTRKSDLIELQRKSPPFGGFTAVATGELARVFASPGPIYEPEARRPDFWRMARALYAAGFRAGDVVHNTFSYHFTPAGAMLESGAHALGCAVFAAGVGQTELQARTLAELRPSAYTGTPSFLKIILDKGDELGLEVSSIRKALVSGEALPASLRDALAARGVDTFQCYATADVGLIAYESAAREGLIVDEGVLMEIVRPGTGIPVEEGEVGEVVVTPLCPEYPLIRFATGDLSAVLAGPSRCGRTNQRIKGWMGRADQTTKVRGMFVHPSQVAQVVKRHPEIRRARLVIGGEDFNDTMELCCEVGNEAAEGLSEAIATSIRDLCKLRGTVSFVEPRSLPNDGKVIDDTRSYE